MRLVSLCFMLASTVYGQTTAQLLKDAWTALQAKNYTATRDASLAAIKLDPKNQTAWFYLGRAYDLLGQTGGAEEAYKTLIAINPRHQAAYNNLGVTYMLQKRADEAIAAYRKQIEVSPHEKFAPFNLARASESRAEAQLHLATVLAKNGVQVREREDFDRVDSEEPVRELAAAAKAATLPPLAWPGHGMQSIRTIEFQRVGEQWVASESYAGETAPPPPCAVAPKPPVTLLTQNGQGSVRSCAGL